MREFEFHAPRSLDEALSLLAGQGAEARPLAGGTDLIPQMDEGRITPRVVVDVKAIPDLNRLEFDEEGLHLGAAVPLANVAGSPVVRECFDLLAQACSLIGSVQIRNRGTVGGNLCNAAPSADVAPPLLCLEAQALIAGPRGRRIIPLEAFFLGPGQTALAPDELLVELIVPTPPAPSGGWYVRHTPRVEMDIAVAGVASLVVLDTRGERCQEARIVLGAVAPTPVRARAAEAALRGRPLDEDEMAITEAAVRAQGSARPIDDVRGSAAYRVHLVKALTQESLRWALEQAKRSLRKGT